MDVLRKGVFSLPTVYEKYADKTVCFIGVGVSHKQLIHNFADHHIRTTVRDRRTKEQLGEVYQEIAALGVTMILGEHYLEDLTEDVIFRTPGIKYYLPELVRARENGQIVTSEMEEFFSFCPCPIIGVTGSDGKTTTTTLISEFLKADGYTVHLGGNIGKALLPEVESMGPDKQFAVVELSSFQLISMRQSPSIAVITNITPNHLDMHKDMQEYVDAKRNLLLHQQPGSKAILGADNEISRSLQKDVRGECLFFSRRTKVDRGACLDTDGTLIMNDGTTVHRLFHMDEIRIPGLHNVENYLAAIAATWGLVRPEVYADVARNFAGVEHRIELVRERNQVKWYNDSIASSPTRVIAGLDSFHQKIILIAGGYDKKIPFEPLAPKILEKVKVLILMGHTAPKIEAAVTALPEYSAESLPILHASTMEEAVALADSVAKAGDIVSLSPACASFDLYPNFEARGRHFKSIVNQL